MQNYYNNRNWKPEQNFREIKSSLDIEVQYTAKLHRNSILVLKLFLSL